MWDEAGRFEEIDSDSGDDQGVGLGHAYKSDELHFTGGDMRARRRGPRRSAYDDDSDDFELDDDFEGEEDERQLAIMDKEELLVVRALERIRRAQALGKTNVKLTAAESDALERKMAKDKAKGRKPVVNTKKLGGSPRSSSRSNLAPAGSRKPSRSSLNHTPDADAAGAPEGYYLPPPSSRPGSRSGSSQSLQHQPPPPLPRNAKRLVSDPEPPYHPSSRSSQSSRRPLPDDPNWQARPRSSSSAANLPYPISPQDYADYPPPPSVPPQYARRNVSGPPDVSHHDPYGRQFPMHMPSVRGYASSSDPSLVRRRDISGGQAAYGGRNRGGGGGGGGGGEFDSSSADSDEDEDGDLDQGVQVEVEVEPSRSNAQGYEVTTTNAVPKKTGNAKSRKARR